MSLNMSDPKNKLILIVEDDDTVVELLKFTLEKENFNVITTNDGEKALEIIRLNEPSLIVLDMMLPKKSGFEVIKSLQTPIYANIPIVVITAKHLDENFKNMVQIEHNVKEFIAKPIKLAYFAYRIHTILGTIPPSQTIAEQKRLELEKKLTPKPQE